MAPYLGDARYVIVSKCLSQGAGAPLPVDGTHTTCVNFFFNLSLFLMTILKGDKNLLTSIKVFEISWFVYPVWQVGYHTILQASKRKSG